MLQRAGIRIPERSVSSVLMMSTDFNTMCRFVLTSVRLPLFEVGRRAAALLLDLIAGHPCDKTNITLAELVIRGTTAPPSGQRRSIIPVSR